MRSDWLQNLLDKSSKSEFLCTLITGVICRIRVEEIQEPLMKETLLLDKLIDEFAGGKAMEKILRT